jgi:signal transduction histidine kinase
LALFEPLERAWRWGWARQDQVAAVVLTAATAVILVQAGLPGKPAAILASASVLAGIGLVAWRRRYPVAVAAAAGILSAVPALTPYGTVIYNNGPLNGPTVLATFMYAYGLGAYTTWRRSLLGLVPLTAGIAVPLGTFNPFVEMATMGPWIGGLIVASRRRLGEQLEARARELDEEREAFAAQAVRYERAVIARELHDVVAHCVSLMVVQANAGERLAQRDPDGAAQAFASITDAARQAEHDIERLVQLLASSSTVPASMGLRIVDDLVGRVRASGIQVSCELSGDTDNVSRETSEACYRLVQEALTNAMKHAPGASIKLIVRGAGNCIEVEVMNGRGAASLPALQGAGGGHGLQGMHERVARCGGTFEAGPTPEGGWRVVASLPRHSFHLADRTGASDGWQAAVPERRRP